MNCFLPFLGPKTDKATIEEWKKAETASCEGVDGPTGTFGYL